MKKLLLAAALAAVAAPGLSHAASTRPDADPAMWVVKDRDTTIYLFGTFHLLDGKRDWFNEEVRDAFDRSDELVLEFVLPKDPAAAQPLFKRYAVDPAGRKLSQRLPERSRKRLEQALASLGTPLAAVDPLEPWFVAMTLVTGAAQRLGITGEHGTETTLTAAAAKRNLKVSGVETLEGQIKMLDATPDALQIRQLEMTMEQLSELQGTFGPMMDAWATGKPERLYSIMYRHLAEDPVSYQAFFVDRNRRWVDWIEQRMQRPGTVFMAVGAAHLAGPDSVQALLARKGVRSRRVPARPARGGAAAPSLAFQQPLQ
jgi:uncharacterized protein YbaP (TraB family)